MENSSERFTQKSIAREFELRGKLQACQKHDRTLSVYLREYKSICDQLNAIGKPVDEITKMFGVLEGLGPEYENFRTTIYCLKPQLDYDEVIAQLERLESRLLNYSRNQFNPNLAYFGQRQSHIQLKENTDGGYIAQTFGFVAQRGNYRGGRSYGRGRAANNRGRVFGYSERNQNYKTDALLQGQKDQQYRQRNVFSGTNQGFRPYASYSQRYQNTKTYPSLTLTSNRTLQDEKETGNVRLECQICKRPGHDALRCWYRFDNSYQAEDIPTALTALHIEDPKGSEWYPDTGATAHISANPGILHTLSKYKGTDTVMIGDGSCLPVTYIGDTSLRTKVTTLPLNDVLIVPEIKKNLLSVSKLTDDYPCSFVFDKNGVYVKDNYTKVTVKLGRKIRGLYQVDTQTTEAFFTQRQRTVDEDIWHQRLAHTNFQIVKHLQHHKRIHYNTTTKNICSNCQIAKSTALSFPLSDSTSSVPLEKIHCDIWGPSPVSSFQKFKYYVVFVNNFSRHSWLYPMKLKSEFYEIFVKFQKLVERQHNHQIKAFQSDGGGEFISSRFQHHLKNYGIKQLISCPHTPEQNGISERKHRHIVELGLAMLYHSKVPLRFWVDAFATANYIVNRLPTSKLKMDTPYNKIHHTQPRYEHLRVFGCTCYPCLRPYAKHKFDPRSLTCVFLGYSEQHKGYRCLVPTDNRVYISRHVVFDETFFPFSKKLVSEYR